MGDLKLIEQHIDDGKPFEFIRNCISCAEVDFDYVCAGGYIGICRFMLECSFDVTYNSNYALCIASIRGDLGILRLLLEFGADVHTNEDYCLRIAIQYSDTEVVRELIDSGADVRSIDTDALCIARYEGHTEVAKLLEDWVTHSDSSE